MTRPPSDRSEQPDRAAQPDPPDRAERAVVPSGVRPLAAVLALVSAVVVTAFGLLHHSSSGADALDRLVRSRLHAAWPQPGPVFYLVDGLVTPVPLLVAALVLVAASLLSGRRRVALLAVLGPVGVAGATTVLKPLVGRTIHGDNLSFPSGHTGLATCVGLLVGLVLLGWAPGRRSVQALLLLLPALLAAAVMTVDQVTLDAHYPTDALGGICTALAVVLALSLATDAVLDAALARRRARESSSARVASGASDRPA